MSTTWGVSAQRRRALKLAWWRYRRPALLLGTVLAVLVGYRIAAPGGPELVPVTVAAHDLAAGSVVAAADVRTVSWPKSAAPEPFSAGAGGVVGATLASPLRTGEAVTRTRLVGRSLLTGQPGGIVAVAVRLADPSGVSIVRAGDRVDVLAAGSGSNGSSPYASTAAQRVATSALVLSTPASSGGVGTDEGAAGLLSGGSGTAESSGSPVLVLAVDQSAAARLAAAQGDRLLSVVLLAGSSSSVGNPAGQVMPDPTSGTPLVSAATQLADRVGGK